MISLTTVISGLPQKSVKTKTWLTKIKIIYERNKAYEKSGKGNE